MSVARPLILANLTERLRDDEIHVWALDHRADSGRHALREVLAAYLAIKPDQVAFFAGPHGRPRLADGHDQSLGFNWSHSADRALIAIGRGITPGVDLEYLRPRPRAMELARRYFCNEEIESLAALPVADRSDAFLGLWTGKEAVLKALGRGIAFGLNRLSIDTTCGRLRLLRLEGDDVGAWQLQRLEVDRDVVAALAWRGGPRRIRMGRLGGVA
ncbi:MAG TPA: 4'-phosphopantetheinyl transferase superfamily protein [Rhodanobacter sp.]